MLDNTYARLTAIASGSGGGFTISKADRVHYDRDWHFSFKDIAVAAEFSYRATCNGFEVTSNIHGDVWVGKDLNAPK